MGFVRTNDEISRLRATMAAPKALSGEMVSVQFRTSAATVERLLPPGLEPADEPTGVAYLGRWDRSNAGPFLAAALFVRARHRGLEGDYCLAMPVSTERALLFGREMIGEPKKLAELSLECDASRANGSVRRGGAELLRIEVETTRELGALERTEYAFHYKYTPRADGCGLESDPVLVRVENRFQVRAAALGSGSLALQSSLHDPYGEIEVDEVRLALRLRADIRARVEKLARVPARDFLPYAFGKMDDWTCLDNE